MSKLIEKQIEQAKQLMAENHEKQIHVKVSNGHMYFDRQNALNSVGGKEDELETIILDADEVDTKRASSPSRETMPDIAEKRAKLKADKTPAA